MLVKFTSEKLINKGKTGVLTPDRDGYYELVVGGLNCFNSAGEYYPLTNSVKQLFENSSTFMRKIKSGKLLGENGHPEYTKDMSVDDYVRRIYYISEQNVVCHFSEIWVDEKFGLNNPEFKNPNLVAIMAKVKPYGEKKHILQDALENRLQNLCFSIRSLTNNYYQRGTKLKELAEIITFDFVTEGGISIANKFDSPSLESMMEDIIVTKEKLIKIYNDIPEGLSTESSKSNILQTINTFDTIKQSKDIKIPIYNKW